VGGIGSVTLLAGHPRRLAALGLIAAIIAPSSGCVWPGGVDYRDHLSLVTSVDAPDSVSQGMVFDVRIATWGPDGCWSKGRDRIVRVDPFRIDIEPSDREDLVGHGGCTDGEVNFQHTVRIWARVPGEMAINVRRRLRAPSGADSSGTIQLKVHVF